MPELDYAVICDYVRVEGGVAHVIAAGIDTITAPAIPTGQNVGLLMRVNFARTECDRPHRVEVIFQDEDGDRLTQIAGVNEPRWNDGLPTGWKVGALLGLNLGIPLPRYGIYSVEILLNDNLVKTIPLRVVPPAPAQ
jgi:hypothetical protein